VSLRGVIVTIVVIFVILVLLIGALGFAVVIRGSGSSGSTPVVQSTPAAATVP
jgi:flagellar basal body-associated protein FliL